MPMSTSRVGNRTRAWLRSLTTPERPKTSGNKICLWPGKSTDSLNPFTGDFSEALESVGYEVEHFSPKRWLLRPHNRYSTLIVHWPEAATLGANPLAHRLSNFAWVLRLASFRASGGKVLWVFHNEEPHVKKHLNLSWFASVTDGVLSPSNTGLDIAMTKYPWLTSSPKGVARLGRYTFPEADEKISRSSLDIPANAKVFITFGNITRYKGLETAIDVFSQLDSQHVLLIVGYAHDADYLRDIRERSNDIPNVVLISRYVNDSELHALLKLSDAALFTFQRILHSSSVVAARSAGLPVLCPPLGSLPEYAALDPGISLLAQRPLTDQVREFNFQANGCLPRQEHYDWNHIAAEIEETLQLVIP